MTGPCENAGAEPFANRSPESFAANITGREYHQRANAANAREEWERAYDHAMQWRDWQTCEILIDERETSDWYVPEEADDE